MAAVWNGSPLDLHHLQSAIDSWCECGEGLPTCSAHRILIDQNIMDHLAFIRAIRDQLETEEWRK